MPLAACARRASLLLSSALVVSISQSSMGAVSLVGSSIPIGSSAFWPAGGYNATSDEYLALWVDVADANGWQLKGQRINPNTGALIGSTFYVSNSPTTVSAIIGAVTYNSTNGEWFVVYQGSISGGADDVLGQRIASNGTKVGGYISLVVKPGYQNAAEVAYDPTNNRYLVVWREVVGSNGQIFSRVFDATGSPVTSELRLSEVDNRQKYAPKVAYNPVAGEYMVIWQDYRNYPGSGQDNDYSDIYGQRVNRTTGAKIGANIPVYAPVGPPYNPDGQDTPNGIVCNTQDGRYAIGFTKLTAAEGWTTSGIVVNSNGTQVAPAFNLSRPNFGAQATPAYNPVSNTYVISYEGPSSNVGCKEISAAGTVLTGEDSIVTGISVRDNVLVIRPSDGRYLQLSLSDTTGLITGQRFTTSTPPGPVTNFVATPANQQITLTWTNPTSAGFTGTMIRFSTSGFPATPTSGTLVVDKANTPGSNDSHVHSGLTNGTLYYYTAFAHNSAPVYSVGVNTSAAPTAPLCYSESFAYANGNLNGNGGWSGSATTQIQVSSQTVLITGGATAFDATRTVTCGDPGTGYIKVTVKARKNTGGTSTMWSLYMNDPAGLNLCRWYGTGSTATGRIGSTALVTPGQTLTGNWDELIAKINPYTKMVEFLFNGVSIGTLDYSSTGAGNTLGRLMFERVNNSGAAGNTISFDDLVVGETSGPPGPAGNPSPANGAANVAITSTLSWSAGSGATSHDVYFGTSSPGTFQGNQTATTFNPGTLTPNTTYYWRIDEKNASGTITGTVWSFTTLPLPGPAGNPSPASGATGVSITSTLSWTAGSNATSHDVYFGTSSPGAFQGNQAGTTFDPGTLAAGTTYYWRIDEKNSSGTTTGTVWSFTTLPLPGAANSPSPANGATGVSIASTLSWTAGSNATSHDVYFGTSSPGAFQGNQAGTTFDPGTLLAGTTYFWRIDEKNSSGTTTGTVWSFTTLPLPGLATSPNPANSATGVSITSTLSWTAGSNATSHDVYFGTSSPGTFQGNQAGTTFNPGTLANGTTYYWRIDEKNGSGTTTGTVWSFTTVTAPILGILNVKVAGAITVDGNSSDWNLADFTSTIRGGQSGTGDIALVGYDGGNLYYAGRWTGGVLPTSAADHTAKVYSRHDATHQYFLVRIDDSDIRTPNPTASNWSNDCVEFYIDPSHNGGSTPMNNSTSDIQLVIDAANQKNVYATTSGYKTQVLAGVTSAVTTDATGWWLEVRITKSALDPDMPASGTFGVDFDFRDNDSNNDPTLTTVYCWHDIEQSGAFPSKIPDRWGDASLATLPVTFSTSPFASGSENWNIVTWQAAGYGLGTMAWDNAVGNPAGSMKSTGSGSTNNTDRCTREGGEINKAISTAGYTTIRLDYELRFNTNQTGATCSGGCDVLENDCADKLAVYYSTNGTAGPWTLLEQVYANAVTQNVWHTRTLNLPSGADNNANFALRFRFQFNQVTDIGRIDNIKLTGTP